MISIPQKVNARLIAGIKKFKPILARVKDKDVNESDTVAIITDILCEVFGYDKYAEVTSEYAIKKTFCDLAIKLNDVPKLLIEAKAIGLTLKDDHVRQATNYGANSGVEWVVLTNGECWRIYKIIFGKPVDTEFVYEFCFSELNPRKDSDLDMMYYLCKESIAKSSSKDSLEDYRKQKHLLSPYMIGQILLTSDVCNCVKRVLKKLSPDAKVDIEEIQDVIEFGILKREVLDNESVADAKKSIAKALKPVAKKVVNSDIK